MRPIAAVVREEDPADFAATDAVNRLAFGRPDEATLVSRLRAEGDVILSLVACAGDEVVGHILFSRLDLAPDLESASAVALAPMAVLPEWQRRGIGSALVREGIRSSAARAVGAIVVLGDPAFYTRFGFSALTAASLDAPFSGVAFMALELAPAVLAGPRRRVRYPPAFGLPDRFSRSG
ncbi:MAG: N-acetyltransferase [Acetobacterales bacterium]